MSHHVTQPQPAPLRGRRRLERFPLARLARAACLLTLALVATACAESDDLPDWLAGAVDEDDTTAFARAFDELSVYDAALARAEQAVATLGSDEVAVDALLRALEAGYDPAQIEAGVDAGTLAADGAIEGETPAGDPLGLVAGLRQSDRPPLPIEQLRAGAQGADEFSPSSVKGTLVILSLLAMGYDGEVVVEALLLGFTVESLPESLLESITGHEACDRDASSLDCGQLLDRCLHHIVIAGEPVARPGCPDPASAAEDGSGNGGDEDRADTQPGPDPSVGAGAAIAGRYRFVPGDAEYNDDYLIVGGGFEVTVDGDAVTATGSVDIENSVVSTNVGRECWDVLTLALAGAQVADDPVRIQLRFTEVESAALGEAGFGCSEGFRDQTGRLDDLLSGEGIFVDLTVSGGMVSGATFEGSVDVEPA